MSNHHLRRIKSIHHALPTTTANQLVHWFIISRVDYRNNILAGVPKYQIDRRQYPKRGSEADFRLHPIWTHSTILKRSTTHAADSAVHRFQAMFYDVQSAACSRPRLHLRLLSHSLDNQLRSNLRSASHNCLVLLPPLKTIKFRERSFGISGPTTWYFLSDSVKDASFIDVFKSKLKTYIFLLS